eukprot:COSAG05_NODE_230_length_13364_cov_33.748662_12_plen_276_part_00
MLISDFRLVGFVCLAPQKAELAASGTRKKLGRKEAHDAVQRQADWQARREERLAAARAERDHQFLTHNAKQKLLRQKQLALRQATTIPPTQPLSPPSSARQRNDSGVDQAEAQVIVNNTLPNSQVVLQDPVGGSLASSGDTENTGGGQEDSSRIRNRDSHALSGAEMTSEDTGDEIGRQQVDDDTGWKDLPHTFAESTVVGEVAATPVKIELTAAQLAATERAMAARTVGQETRRQATEAEAARRRANAQRIQQQVEELDAAASDWISVSKQLLR